MSSDDEFWGSVVRLLETSELAIDRPKGCHHPRFPEFVYPVNYGYLAGTTSGDGEGIDVWIGEDAEAGLIGLYVTVDPYSRNMEPKLVLNVSAHELELIDNFYERQPQSATYLARPS